MKPASLERQAQADLIRLADIWCTATGESISAVGRRIVKDSQFFTNLIDKYNAGPRQNNDTKGSFTFRIYDVAIAWFFDPSNWPNGEAPNILELADFTHVKKHHQDRSDSRGEKTVLPGSAVQALARLRKIRKKRKLRTMRN